jgi:hypothetical protein
VGDALLKLLSIVDCVGFLTQIYAIVIGLMKQPYVKHAHPTGTDFCKELAQCRGRHKDNVRFKNSITLLDVKRTGFEFMNPFVN